jgi:hypothetical protein
MSRNPEEHPQRLYRGVDLDYLIAYSAVGRFTYAEGPRQ